MSVDSKMTAIADAIRDKTGKTDTLTLDAMATEIASIEGGNQLNFTVVGGTTEPTSPTENMIWVNTSTDITSYIFSATEPEGYAEGMVWISTGTSSPAEFNVLKKNGIQVYPIGAKQYVSGAWVDKTVKSYQDGAWVGWTYYLLKSGEYMNALADGFVKAQTTSQIVLESGYIKFYNPSADGCISTPTKINITGRTKIRILGRVAFATGAPAKYLARLDSTKPTNYTTTGAVASVRIPISTVEAQEFELPVPSDGGEYFLSFTCGGTNGTTQYVEIVDIILE